MLFNLNFSYKILNFYVEFKVYCFLSLQLKTAREAVKYGAVGSVIGAVSTGGLAWKYSRSLHGIAFSCQHL